MLLRLAYLGVTNARAMLRILPMSDRAKDLEILTLRDMPVFQDGGFQLRRAPVLDQ